MRRIGLEIGYEGTQYAGWQRQQNGLGIQQVLEETLARLFHETVHVMGAGRTDAGVHARGQVAALDLAHPIATDRLLLALNSNLPPDIRIYRVWEAEKTFHPRFQAKRKTYGYRFFTGPVMPPELRRYFAPVRGPLQEEAMRAGLAYLVGEHDFAAFRAAGGQNLSTVRRIDRAELLVDGEGWRIDITGNGFLYNMVRIIAGTAFEVGKGKLPPEAFLRALETGKRSVLGPTAPPQGLMLMKIEYES